MPTTISCLFFSAPPSPVIFLNETQEQWQIFILEDMNSRVRVIGIRPEFEVRVTA